MSLSDVKNFIVKHKKISLIIFIVLIIALIILFIVFKNSIMAIITGAITGITFFISKFCKKKETNQSKQNEDIQKEKDNQLDEAKQLRENFDKWYNDKNNEIDEQSKVKKEQLKVKMDNMSDDDIKNFYKNL